MKRLAYFLLFAAYSAMAQGPGPGIFPWWDSPIARDLHLSDAQNKQIGAILKEFRPQITQLRATLENAEGDLSDAMNEDNVDSAKANVVIEKVIAARSEMARAVSKMSLRLRLVLTASQWRELQRRQPRPPDPPPERQRPPR